jgi:class 3 adenylate cyclase
MTFRQRVCVSASQDRLEALIAGRLQSGADQESVDRRIWDLFGETWSVMFTDLSGFSRRVAEFGIIHFLQTIYEAERLLLPCIDEHDGILLKLDGDSMLVIFRRPERALDCAVRMQTILAEYNLDRPDTERILLCVGLGYGHLLHIGDADVFGAEVNAASKMGEDMGRAGEILVTGAVADAVRAHSPGRFEPLDTVPAGAQSAFRYVYS